MTKTEEVARALFERHNKEQPLTSRMLYGEDLSWDQLKERIAGGSIYAGALDGFLADARTAIEAMRVPTDAMWVGLARDIVMWMDMAQGGQKTPRALFKHLEMKGRAIPQWLRDEPEMQHLGHVPSKGTRAAIIYFAMIDEALK